MCGYWVPTFSSFDQLKFGFSEKATNFEKIFVVLLTRALCSVHTRGAHNSVLVKKSKKIFQNKCGQVVLYKFYHINNLGPANIST